MCLLEAGGTNDNWRIKTPGMMPFLPDQSNYRFDTVPQAGLNGRAGYQPRGRGLGGSSAINAMLYVRGNAYDYDNWAALGCDGWSYHDVLPFFRKAEANERGGDGYHGADGPLHVSDQHWFNPASGAFVAAASELQLPVNGDFNGEKTGRLRHLPDDAAGRRALVGGACLSRPGARPAQPGHPHRPDGGAPC